MVRKLVNLIVIFSLPLILYAQPKCANMKTDTVFYGDRSANNIHYIKYICGNEFRQVTYNYDGSLISDRNYISQDPYNPSDMKLHGLARDYYQGRLISEATYKFGSLCGKYLEWTNYGRLIKENNYRCFDSLGRTFSVQHGKQIEYDRTTLKLKYKGTRKNGKTHGNWKTYNYDGSLHTKGKFKEDHSVGKHVTWSVSGKKHRVYRYKIGKLYGREQSQLHGRFKERNQNSLRLEKKGKYRKGKTHGLWKTYYANGNKASRIRYKNGLVNGVNNTYYENGKPHVVSKLKQNKANQYSNRYHGVFKEYAFNGVLLKRYRYKDGKLDGKIVEYNSKGEMVRQATYDKGLITGTEYRWIKPGQDPDFITYKITERNNAPYSIKHGPFQSTSNGLTKGVYVDDQLHGELLEYYLNGKSKRISNWEQGRQTGIEMTFNDKGDTTMIKNYILSYGVNNPNGESIKYKSSYAHGKYITRSYNAFELRHESIFFYNQTIGLTTQKINHKLGSASIEMLGEGIQVRAEYYSDESLQNFSVKLNHSNAMSFSWYPEGKLRQVICQLDDSVNYQITINLSSEGDIINARMNTRNGLTNMAELTAREILKLIPSRDDVKSKYEASWSGSVSLNYTNGSPLFTLSCKERLPDGRQLVLNPYGDTLLNMGHSQGLEDGPYYKKNGYRKFTIANYSNGKLTGDWVNYIGNQTPHQQKLYNNGALQKSWDWAPTGFIRSYMNYVTGESKSWFTKDQLKHEKTLVPGITYKRYNDRYYSISGQLLIKATSDTMGYQNEYLEFYDTTQQIGETGWYNGLPLLSKSIMKNGRREGYAEFYHPEGTMMQSGYYLSGTQFGRWEVFTKSGYKTLRFYNGYSGQYESLEKLPCSCNDAIGIDMNGSESISNKVKLYNLQRKFGRYTFFADSIFKFSAIKNFSGDKRNATFDLLYSHDLDIEQGNRDHPSITINRCGNRGSFGSLHVKLKTSGNGEIESLETGPADMSLKFKGSYFYLYDTTIKKILFSHDGIQLPFKARFKVDGLSYDKSNGKITLKNPVVSEECFSSSIYHSSYQYLIHLGSYTPYVDQDKASLLKEMEKTLNSYELSPIRLSHYFEELFTGVRIDKGAMEMMVNRHVCMFEIKTAYMSKHRIYAVLKADAIHGSNNQIVLISKNGFRQSMSVDSFRSYVARYFQSEVIVTINKKDEVILYVAQ